MRVNLFGLALGSGLEGALDLAAVTTTLTSAWKESFKQGSVIVSDGKPTAAHVGPSPQLLTGAANLRPDLVGSVFDAYGVPRSLFLASGAGSRDALRLFTATTGSWLASLTERAARRVLDETLTVSATRANTPADAVSRARAVHSLTQAGVEVDRSAEPGGAPMRSALSNAGGSRRWRKIRMAAIRRAEFICGRCGLQFAAARLEVHHIHGRELGDVSANLAMPLPGNVMPK